MPDTDHTLTYTVTVSAYGDHEQVHRETLLSLGRALHSAFGDRFTITSEGTTVIYDPLAADGHHSGHDDPLPVVFTE